MFDHKRLETFLLVIFVGKITYDKSTSSPFTRKYLDHNISVEFNIIFNCNII